MLLKALQTIVQQGHLCPVAHEVQPVYWEYDTALDLQPPPDVLLLAERARQYQATVAGSVVGCNPGSFALNGTFVVYRPECGELELSQVAG
jgi:DNA polymerase epsilon subunit 2